MSVQEPLSRRRILSDPLVAERIIRERAEIGMDKFDEVWEGEYRMVAAPNNEHDRIDTDLLEFLRSVARKYDLGRVGYLGVRQPGSGDENYRIPDRVFISKARMPSVLSDWGCEGGPDLAVEIRSPGDDTYRKLPFYAKVGVNELLVVHRDTKRAELFRNVDGSLLPTSTAAGGWLRLETLPVEVRSIVKPDGAPGLEAHDTRDGSLTVAI